MKSYRVIWQYILFYFIISVIPISAILFYFYPLAKEIVIRKARESNTNVTRNITNTMNTQISGIYNIAREIKMDSKLTPYALTRDRYAEIEAVSELKKIVSSSGVVYDVLYYMKENNTLYTKNTLIRVDTYDSRYTVYKYKNRNMQQFLAEMTELDGFRVLPAEPVAVSSAGVRNMITFVFPAAGKTDGSSRTVALLLVEESALTRLVDIYSGKYEDNVLIFDFDGNLVTSSNKYPGFSEEVLMGLPEWEGQEESGILNFGGENFIFSKVVSGTNGWSYISYMNMEELTGELTELRNQTILIIIAIMLLEILLIAFFSRQNYRPVKKLLDLLQEEAAKEKLEKITPKNEFRKMEYIFGSLFQLNDELHDKIRQAYPAMRNELLKKLINGQLMSVSVDMINRIGEEVGVRFTYSLYSVAVISFEPEGHTVNLKAVNDLLNLPVKGRVKFYAVSDMRKNIAVLLTNQDREEELINCLKRAREELIENFHVQAWIGVSKCACDIREYSFLYVQALSVLEFLRLEKETGVIRMGNLALCRYAFKDCPPDLTNQPELAEGDSFAEVLAYIDESCLRYDFSIHMAAVRFGAKVSNFSQYFKKKSGVTFKQYVDFQKVDRAKKLLAETEESLEQISEALAYSNASSFIRAFKRVSNMTPGEYREKLKQEQ